MVWNSSGTHYKGSHKSNHWKTVPGYEEIEKCRFGCGADVFFSVELKRWLEPRTRFVHSKIRCETIKERAKIAAEEKNQKTLRPDVVQELKAELAEFPAGTDLIKMLYHVLKKRKFEIDKVSIRELAMSFYPSDAVINLCGDKEPNHDAIERMSRMLANLRKNPHNRATLVYSKKFENGVWYYYNLQTETEYKPVEERLVKQRNGIDETLAKNTEILESGVTQRKKAEKEFENYLNVKEIKKKKRKENESQNNY